MALNWQGQDGGYLTVPFVNKKEEIAFVGVASGKFPVVYHYTLKKKDLASILHSL